MNELQKKDSIIEIVLRKLIRILYCEMLYYHSELKIPFTIPDETRSIKEEQDFFTTRNFSYSSSCEKSLPQFIRKSY